MSTIAMFALAGLMLSAAPAKDEPKAAPAAEKTEKKGGEMWNGGKQSPPFAVKSSLQGTVEADQDLPLTITVTPRKGCAGMTTVLRGIDGVAVKGEPAHHACAKDQSVRHEGTLRVPAGVAGSVVVDVTMEINGKKVSSSRTFPVAAQGATPKKEEVGEVTKDAKGQPLIIMQSQPQK